MLSYKRLFVIALAALLFPLQAFSENITFPVKGLLSVPKEPVPLPAAWNEAWFSETKAGAYHHGIARIACILATASYTDVDSSGFTDSLSQCYHKLGFSNEQIEYHYDIDYQDPQWGNDQCAFSFARRTIQTDAGKKTLVCIVVRGTPLSANEWISNLDIGAESDKNSEVTLHAGFTRATQQVLTAFYAYLLENHIDASQSYFLITGHSRGAAVANLLGVRLIENQQFSSRNLFVYTFASPNVTTDTAALDERYNFIWNIVNAEDIVPTVPLARNRWQFKKYGSVRVLANAWNTSAERYQTSFMPRINALYQKMMLRAYEPFGTGPFIPVQLTRILSHMNKDVSTYYSKRVGVHNIAEKVLWKVFPQKDAEDERTEQKNSLFVNWLNSATDGLVDHLAHAASDMHAPEMYLACMLALDEDEVFAESGSAELVCTGSFEGAVFDSTGNVLVQVLDNHVVYKSVRLPAAAFQIMPTTLVIGLPSNEDFTVVCYHSSLLPSPVSIRIEHYDASGVLQTIEEPKKMHLHKSMALRFLAGKTTLAQAQVAPEKIKGKIAKKYIQDADLSSLWDFKLLFEANMNSNWIFSGGVHVGAAALYGTALVGHRSNGIDDTLQATAGIGTQQTLWGAVQMDIEGMCHFVQDFDTPFSEDDTSGFSFVPAARFSLSIKPRRRIQFFGALNYDMHIDGWNDRAFDNALRSNTSHGIDAGTLSFVPTVQFGIKF